MKYRDYWENKRWTWWYKLWVKIYHWVYGCRKIWHFRKEEVSFKACYCSIKDF